MKTISLLLAKFVLIIILGLQPGTRGVMGGNVREPVHMNRASQALIRMESGSDGGGELSADGGIRSFYH